MRHGGGRARRAVAQTLFGRRPRLPRRPAVREQKGRPRRSRAKTDPRVVAFFKEALEYRFRGTDALRTEGHQGAVPIPERLAKARSWFTHFNGGPLPRLRHGGARRGLRDPPRYPRARPSVRSRLARADAGVVHRAGSHLATRRRRPRQGGGRGRKTDEGNSVVVRIAGRKREAQGAPLVRFRRGLRVRVFVPRAPLERTAPLERPLGI